jgi:hypothetical protein
VWLFRKQQNSIC